MVESTCYKERAYEYDTLLERLEPLERDKTYFEEKCKKLTHESELIDKYRREILVEIEQYELECEQTRGDIEQQLELIESLKLVNKRAEEKLIRNERSLSKFEHQEAELLERLESGKKILSKRSKRKTKS